ncbi:CrcB family protein [Paenarthrobacter aurescens]|uniref:Fluoride-specific ion channel FluC n=1 Tax=Paenarthrobacter aurescens TaxID=43663 RepID=A0A4Y3NGB0_PAEAU|nr:CrcB family protein [Paenarthrobacter aurescens]MDO6144253.1 CrcB family protein [Paenarthrobacter aurescens]MDO6148100.1 CrcB family protein [Paenarthrobacter aurescens]MDO6159344.1 CrcB family protein [Paenarthrobacter aurescens]MDO6163327.1 CrcB family protein [Paenarthrobacter aurescens]GEB20850.1 putative fluoride ion transporter CrcB [Paenarthrobacter aurescens]
MTTTEVKRPLHFRWHLIGIVAAGGVFGALARHGLGLVIPAPGAWPLPTLIINLSGALALGLLLEGLSRRGPDAGTRRVLRLALGTGFLGAFTTYSTLALDAVHLLMAGAVPGAAGYLAASLFGGAAAATAGIWLGAWQHRRVTGGQL